MLLGVKHDTSTHLIYCDNFIPMGISTPRSSHDHKSPCIQMKTPQHLAKTVLGEKPRSNTKISCICFNLSVALGGLGLLHHCKRCQISTLKCLLVDFPVIALLDVSQREKSIDDGRIPFSCCSLRVLLPSLDLLGHLNRSLMLLDTPIPVCHTLTSCI